MIPIEFIPTSSSYSIENEYNDMLLINIEHSLTKENFKNKLIEDILCVMCLLTELPRYILCKFSPT